METTGNEQAAEVERLLNKKAATGSDDKFEYVFNLSYGNGSENWFCNFCDCSIAGGVDGVHEHETDKRHIRKLGLDNHDSDKPEEKKPEEEPVTIDIAAGEPIPPGFEEQHVNRVAQIQEQLDRFTDRPLVGLEYVFELHVSAEYEKPEYLCVLCNKTGNYASIVLAHVRSCSHISQYLHKHFSTCHDALVPYMTKRYKRNWQNTLQKIAEAIEKKFGRLKPYSIEKDTFEKNKVHYLQIVADGEHFSQDTGVTFKELVVHTELVKPCEVVESDEASVSTEDATAHIEKPLQLSSSSLPKETSSESTQSGKNVEQSVSLFNLFRIANTKKKKAQGKKMSREEVVNIMEFRRQGKVLDTQMYTTLKLYEKNPDKCPQYHEEWQKLNLPEEMNPNRCIKRAFFPTRINKSSIPLKKDKIGVVSPLAKVTSNGDKLTTPVAKKSNQNNPIQSKKGNSRPPTKTIPAPIKFKIGPPSKSIDNKPSLRVAGQVVYTLSGSKTTPILNKPSLPAATQPDKDIEVIVIDDKDDSSKKDTSKFSIHGKETERMKSPKKSVSKETLASLRSKSGERRRNRKSRSRDRSRSRRRYLRKSRSRDRSRSRRRYLGRDRSRSRRKRFGKSRSRSGSRLRELLRRLRDSRSQNKKSLSREKSLERNKDISTEIRDTSKDGQSISPVADLPLEKEKVHGPVDAHYKLPEIVPGATKESGIMPNDDDDGQINIINVLRILTALEERLGSLGPKIIDLVGQALVLEKRETNSSETLLDSDLNCVLLETVNEKLKGQLLAGLVDTVEEKAFKKAVNKTSALISMAEQRKTQKKQMVPSVNNIDKTAIANQIAIALILQGRTNVAQAEIEQLTNAMISVAQVSKISSDLLAAQPSGGNVSLITSDWKQEINLNDKLRISSSNKSSVIELGKLSEPPTPHPLQNPINNMGYVPDPHLQHLLQNFMNLAAHEQRQLIDYLKILEIYEPERAERLREFVISNPNSKIKTIEGFENQEISDDIRSSVPIKQENSASGDLWCQTERERPEDSYESTNIFSKRIKEEQLEMEDNANIINETMVFETNNAIKFEPPSPPTNNSNQLNFDPPYRPISPVLRDLSMPLSGDTSIGFDNGGQTIGPIEAGIRVSPSGNIWSLRSEHYGSQETLSRDDRGSVLPSRDLALPADSFVHRDVPVYPTNNPELCIGAYGNNKQQNQFSPT
ncbi:hypothetical protein NQ315_005871 [Exocentrus adspersus]|uniref:Uncharacterized protein n=1 Tax=Exocentrus adspersus TaxID=1586481 RepID=A0AAV8VRV4_9CUCU|nr:hypothetical protein NQ315_005871 [Exocentrus adspersus]